MKVKNFLYLGLLLFFFSCKKNDAESTCYEKELLSINFDFESTLEDWVNLGGSGDRKFESDIEITNDHSSSGNSSVKFSVSQASYVNNGVRAELTFDQQIEEGDQTIYEYSFFIPNSYQDVWLKDAYGQPNWQVIGQWHDQPDECIGETWNNYQGNSPPIAIYYNYFDQNDPSFQETMEDAISQNIFGLDTSWNQISTISLIYGGEPIAITQIEKGEWNRLKFRINWSTSNSGNIEAWINNSSFTNGIVYGKNMINKASHYFKFGLYRNPNITYTNTLYFDDINIY